MASLVFFDIARGMGGAEVSLAEICTRCVSRVHVICAQGGMLEARLRETGVRVHPVPVGRLRGGGLFSKVINYSRIRKARKELRRVLEHEGGDVFIANNLAADFAAGPVPARFCRACVSWVRDDPATTAASHYIRTRDLAVAPSRTVMERLSDMGISRSVMIHNGIDTAYFKDAPSQEQAREILGLPQNSLILGSAGQFIRRKGWEMFVACAERIAEQVEDLICIIAGEDMHEGSRYVKKIRAMTASSPAGDSIRILGFQEDMRPFYAACDVFASLSRNEPFGRTPLEAALCGALPVVSDEGGYRETLGEIQQLMVDPSSIDSVCGTAAFLLQNGEERRSLLEKARTAAERFSADVCAGEFEKACLGLLGK